MVSPVWAAPQLRVLHLHTGDTMVRCWQVWPGKRDTNAELQTTVGEGELEMMLLSELREGWG